MAPPTFPGLPTAGRISKAALCIEQPRSLACQGGGGRRDAGRWEAPKVLLTGVPRGLGPGRMVHTWVAASVSLGSGVCPGAQVSFLGGGGGVWPGALSRSADPGKLVFWSTCPSKDGEMTVLSGCLSSPSRLVFPFWVQNGGEVRGKQLLYLRSGLCAGPVLCGWGVRAAPGSHS